ncbi:hypothetical protein FC093_17995 [Ilyomonas limi]|uniref:T9SS C-terminal target domain-containing protein n=1 Tax=Ilyomonas limi TaxID=2575867 RepID=A0A4U3KUD0_9BACT|nr:hypothetical protein [Ilyomonas limi]TKK66145.1 hypothetical protein FC093_17995 [Ilyomonas limi]
MKKIAFAVLAGMLMIAATTTSCKKSDNMPDPPIDTTGNGGGNDTATDIMIRGVISSSQTWTKNKTYHLRGYVYVTDGATLTIEPGTKIVSNKDSAGVLVIYRDATINAAGTATEPIVFTSGEASPAPGDLGGIVLVGQATTNGNHSVLEGGVDPNFSAFGGSNDEHSSGTLQYVRIEYAGKAVNPGDEVNGLSLYGVGAGTIIDYVQVVRGLDDAFEFFGGTVNCKHLIAYNCADDDFDMDDGYRGKIQFAISVKDPVFTDNKGTSGDISNNFEVDNINPNNGFLFTRAPITFPVLSNFTAIGPNNATGTSTDYGYGMRWRRGSKFILANSIVMGSQKAGLDLDDDSTVSYYKQGISRFYNSFLNASAVAVPYKIDKLDPKAIPPVWDTASLRVMTETTNRSRYYATAADMMLADPFNDAAPGLKPTTGSPALTVPAAFDLTELSDSFFDKVSFIGAFDATNDWTTGWAIWGK